MAENNVLNLIKVCDRADKRINPPELKAKEIEALYSLVVDWKPDLLLVGILVLPLALMISKIVPVPVVGFTLQNARPSKTLKPPGFPHIPSCLNVPFWRLATRAGCNLNFKDLSPILEKLSGTPASQLWISTSEHSQYHHAKCTFLSIIATVLLYVESCHQNAIARMCRLEHWCLPVNRQVLHLVENSCSRWRISWHVEVLQYTLVLVPSFVELPSLCVC